MSRFERVARAALIGFMTALAAAACGCTNPTVLRVIDGREVAGRFVSARAYALYARGAESEARGELESARVEYLAAGDDDGSNAEIWTRIGAVSCALGREADAQSAFDRAAKRADDYEPLFRERAKCALVRVPTVDAVAKSALADASRALALDPENEETVLLYARAAENAGDEGRAENALRELVARSPGRVAGWRALRDFARRRTNPVVTARAVQALRELGDAAAPADGPRTVGMNSVAPTLDQVDAALSRDALDEARSLAKRARVAPAELAVRAAALGRSKLAQTQAELVFLADPTSASAAIALAVAADILRDDKGVTRALANAAAQTTPPSPLARLLLAELLLRRTDRDAARAFAGPISLAVDPADTLLLATSKRVATQLQK